MSSKLKIDLHVHLAGTGCKNSGCWISENFRKKATFRILKILRGLSNDQLKTTADQDWVNSISTYVKNSELDHAVALGFDAVINPSSGEEDLDKSQMIIPHDWVFKVCEKEETLLPGPSINPYRKDAISRLEECIDRGAVLIKWLPATQAINPGEKRHTDFFKLLAAEKVPLLVHMGGERTFAEVSPEQNDISRLNLALDLGVKVICAHSATRILGSKEPDRTDELHAMLKRHDNLWVDNSGICNPGRFAHLPRLANDPIIRERTLHGSDFPVPSNAFYYAKRLGLKETMRLERIKNVLARDIEIKRAVGFPDATLTRASEVLRLDRII